MARLAGQAAIRVNRIDSPPGDGPLERLHRDLETLANERWDLVVVGGGIVGAGILLDAVSRGLRAALIEQDDIAWGTSSRSSRLIHGGLRYLEQLHVGLVREALAERARLLDLAPHLVRLEPLLFPLYGLPAWNRLFYGSGIGFYDVLGSARRGGRSRHLSTGAVLEIAPHLPAQGAARRDRLPRCGRGRRPLRPRRRQDGPDDERPRGHPVPGKRPAPRARTGHRGVCRGPPSAGRLRSERSGSSTRPAYGHPARTPRSAVACASCLAVAPHLVVPRR